MSDDYEVGHGRPPKHTQFQKGKSGNPRGRPKGARNLTTDLAEELSEQITITEQGSRRRLTKQQALIKSLYAKALNGNMRAATLLINMTAQAEAKGATQETTELSAEDRAMAEEYMKQLRGSANGGQAC